MSPAPPRLSVVAPLYDEAGVAEELASRCLDAAAASGLSHEVVLVDDHSGDGTGALLEAARERHGWGARLSVVRLDTNHGQFGATVQGLRAARGELVVVLDGDLQDPPETIAALVAALDADPTRDVAFALKSGRDERGPMRVGIAAFHALQAAFGRGLPPGAGSYCAMRADVAARVARVDLRHVNLASVLAVLEPAFTSVPYHKAARYDGRSRVGAVDLAREAWGSLVVTGAAQRLCGLAGLTLAGGGAACASAGLLPPAAALGALAALAFLAAVDSARRRRRIARAVGARR